VVSGRAFNMILSRGYVRSVKREYEAGDGECVGCAGVTRDYGEDVYLCFMPVASEGFGKSVYVSRIRCAV
jgi:hypothetical protein